MRIQELTVGPVATCCYILSAEDRPDCLVIDPGAEPDRIRKAAGDRKIAAILLTHGHFDHIGAAGALMAQDPAEGIRLLVHEKDAPMLTDIRLNASLMLLRQPVTAPAPTDTFREGDVLSLAGLEVQVLHTPGHTPGSSCFRIGGHLFTGDTMFEHGWGRTDLPGGNEHDLFASLRRLIPLAQQIPIHPGHDA